jgi:hypothetical protein
MTAPTTTPKSEAARADRLAREAAALRQNLRRRKAQERARDDAVEAPCPATTDAPSKPEGAA